MKLLLRSIALCLSLPLFGVACSKSKARTHGGSRSGRKGPRCGAERFGSRGSASPTPTGPPLKVAY